MQPLHNPKLPLEGVRILDFTVVWAGSFATMLLADLGAEVIKVENTHVWQPLTRGMMAHIPQAFIDNTLAWMGGYPHNRAGPRPYNYCPTFANLYRNKHSVTMDIRRQEGKEILERLIRCCDVVYENNVSETMEKLGITYDYLRAIREDIIYVRMPAYGSDGPYKNYRALGVHLEGVTGHSLLRHYHDTDPSANSAIYAADYLAGAQGAFAVMAALHYRNRTGKGQLIELSQAENATALLAQFFMDYSMNGREGQPLGNRDLHGAAPNGVYPCADEDRGDRWIAISIRNDDDWAALKQVLGNPRWMDEPRFGPVTGRRNNHDELDRLMAGSTRSRNRWELAKALQEQGVPAGPVLDARDAFENEHLRSRAFFHKARQRDAGEWEWPGPLFRLSRTPLGVRKGPVSLGEDNEYVYKTLLGYSEEEYRRFVESGHIGEEFDPEIP